MEKWRKIFRGWKKKKRKTSALALPDTAGSGNWFSYVCPKSALDQYAPAVGTCVLDQFAASERSSGHCATYGNSLSVRTTLDTPLTHTHLFLVSPHTIIGGYDLCHLQIDIRRVSMVCFEKYFNNYSPLYFLWIFMGHRPSTGITLSRQITKSSLL